MFTFILSLIIFLSIIMTLLILAQKPTSLTNTANSSANNRGGRLNMDVLEYITWGLIGTIFLLCIVSSYILKNNMKPQSIKNIKIYDNNITANDEPNEPVAKENEDSSSTK
jgi:preprotein translocase subunit SecG